MDVYCQRWWWNSTKDENLWVLFFVLICWELSECVWRQPQGRLRLAGDCPNPLLLVQQKTQQSISASSISLSHPQNFGRELIICHPLKLSCSADRWPTLAARACSHQSLLSPHSDISFSGLLPSSFSHTVLTDSISFLFSYNPVISAP